MAVEQDDVQLYLRTLPLFAEMADVSLSRVLNSLTIQYFKAGQRIPLSENMWLAIIRNGSLELQDDSGQFQNRYSNDDVFTAVSSATSKQELLALEDSLVYSIDSASLEQLSSLSKTLRNHIKGLASPEISQDLKSQGYVSDTNFVADIMSSAVLCVSVNDSIHETAKKMSQHRVSSALVVSADKLVGIVTDRDFRSRVLALGVDASESVRTVMTEHPRFVAPETTVYEAQHCMMSKRVHHLPVLDGDDIAGVVTLNDFIRAQNSEPLFLVRSIHRSEHVEQMAEAARMLPDLVMKLINNNARPDHIGRTITTITDAVIRRAIELGFEQFGPAPCDYTWLAFGSQGRFDQMLGSDQDNALILSNSATEQDRAYFLQVASFVNDALALSGIKYCPGEIMARNPEWCLTLREWERKFLAWIEQPDPKALMHASIFFDLRRVEGSELLSERLQKTILTHAKENTIFLAMLSDNAQQLQPPLGFFKSFVLESNGDHLDMLDLKHRGTVPIVSIARVLALANNIAAVNTNDRLRALIELRAISRREGSNLIDAHEFISKIRIENQGRQMQAGEKASNYINPKSLSPFIRHQLKDAFKAVREAQKLVLNRFNHGFM